MYWQFNALSNFQLITYFISTYVEQNLTGQIDTGRHLNKKRQWFVMVDYIFNGAFIVINKQVIQSYPIDTYDLQSYN